LSQKTKKNKELALLKKLAVEKNELLIAIARKIVGEQDATDVVNTAIAYLLTRCQDKTGKYKEIKEMKIELLVQVIKTRSIDVLRRKKARAKVMNNRTLNNLQNIKMKF